MDRMENYAFAKLSDVNFRMAIHEGDANRRLASQAEKILLISPLEVPKKFQKKFEKLHSILKGEIERTSPFGIRPSKLRSIRNTTAIKFIEVLYLIEHSHY